ncbi:hypothetical protein GBAR_LOCUS9258 [Geodia barretti]|uniref:Uncharacterized protein n=1 Tax=Geodia barretti TaxID=519541 RepID=A0AA35RNI5_GEOBA|nr:hypothetical protein GBAR_LOCUS9258 [Geodia barretti]
MPFHNIINSVRVCCQCLFSYNNVPNKNFPATQFCVCVCVCVSGNSYRRQYSVR